MINYNKQAGGTILGVIIGLILGLSIAVVVAMAITKTPVPFINRPAKIDKTDELTPGQIADPNKAMYGNKKPAEEAAKEFAKTDVPAADPVADKKADAKAGAKDDVKTAADKAKAKTDAATAKAADGKTTAGKDAAAAKPGDGKTAAGKDVAAKSDNMDDKWTYFLQAGAFREQADAENAKAKLALLGVETHMSERPSENGILYRVRVGPFTQVEAMNRVRSKLSDNGVDVAVVRIPK